MEETNSMNEWTFSGDDYAQTTIDRKRETELTVFVRNLVYRPCMNYIGYDKIHIDS